MRPGSTQARAGVLLLLGGAVGSGCARQRVEADALSRLARIEEDIASAEARQVVATKAAAEAECRARSKQLAAEVATASAECSLQYARAHQCLASVARQQADNTLASCVLGIAAAAVTAGAGVPIALGACVAGRALSEDEESCAIPTCDADEGAAWASTLVRHHLGEVPLCGGSLGVSLVSARAAGIAVEDAIEGTDAEEMGVSEGDTLLRIGDVAVSDLEALRAALAALPMDGPIDVTVWREGRVRLLQGHHTAAQLGVEIDETVVVDGAAVLLGRVPNGGQADRAGLREGDILRAIEGEPVLSVTQARLLLSAREEGQQILLAVERGGRILEKRVLLAAREDADAF